MLEFSSSLSYLLLATAVVASFLNMRALFYVYVAATAFTTLSVFDVGSSYIVLYHLLFIALVVRTIFLHVGRKTAENRCSISPIFGLFLLVCALSIPLALIYTDVVVMVPDGSFRNVAFSAQQFTQLGYLIIAVLSCYISNRLLHDGIATVEGIFSALTVAYVAVCLLALLQLVIPASIVNETYRNIPDVYYEFDGARVSSTFREPSMMALCIAPLFAVYLLRLIRSFSFGNLVLVCLGAIVVALNQASSFAVGVCFALFCYAFIAFAKADVRQAIDHKALLGAVFSIMAVFLIASTGIFQDVTSQLVAKINGEGVSGSERTYALQYHLQVFLEHPVVGIGFGTVRSFDLLSTWLVELGVVGIGFFVLPVCALLARLARQGKTQPMSYEAAVYITVYLGILFVSVAEPYYPFGWIVIGLGFYLAPSASYGITKGKANEFFQR